MSREGMASSWNWKMEGKEEDFKEEVVVMVDVVVVEEKRMLLNVGETNLYTSPLTESVTC